MKSLVHKYSFFFFNIPSFCSSVMELGQDIRGHHQNDLKQRMKKNVKPSFLTGHHGHPSLDEGLTYKHIFTKDRRRRSRSKKIINNPTFKN